MSNEILVALLRSLIIPPLSLLILFGIGYLIKNSFPRTGRLLRISAMSVLLLLSTTAGSRLLVTPLEKLEAPLSHATNTGAEAIVVLSAGSLENSPEYDYLSTPDYIALARIRYAAKLYRDTSLPILVTGGMARISPVRNSLASGMSKALEYEFAIPVKWQEDQSRNTRENADFSAKILKQAGISHILLVTDAMHMRRAKTSFEQAGLRVTSAPTVFFSGSELSVLSFLPNVEALRRSQYAIYEWLGIIKYWIVDQYGKPASV
jgi:uncharacterized SAM-binding protein YcdF (DUF218 family)